MNRILGVADGRKDVRCVELECSGRYWLRLKVVLFASGGLWA